jgi:hypothetical protein
MDELPRKVFNWKASVCESGVEFASSSNFNPRDSSFLIDKAPRKGLETLKAFREPAFNHVHDYDSVKRQPRGSNPAALKIPDFIGPEP